MSDFEHAVCRMESIDLTELNDVASLSTRRDRKYVVSPAVAQELVGECELKVLEIDGLRTFRYESVYFDTPDRVSYWDAAHRRRRRFKVRTRSYLDSGLCTLEVKTRERRGLTEKHRLPYSIQTRAELTTEALAFINGFEAVAPASAALQPSLTTRYSRTTLLDARSGSRVTIDTDLEFETPDGSVVRLGNLAIVETKTKGQPCAVDHFLWRAHQRPTKISKYCTSLAALTPGLAASKWNRVLRTHFGWTPDNGAGPIHRVSSSEAVAVPVS